MPVALLILQSVISIVDKAMTIGANLSQASTDKLVDDYLADKARYNKALDVIAGAIGGALKLAGGAK